MSKRLCLHRSRLTYFSFASCHVNIDHHDTPHVTSRTRPSSRFSACNIEKLGMGLGMKLTPSLVPRLSLSFSQFMVWNPAHPWLPGQGLGGHALHCASYCSRTAFWTVLTSLIILLITKTILVTHFKPF